MLDSKEYNTAMIEDTEEQILWYFDRKTHLPSLVVEAFNRFGSLIYKRDDTNKFDLTKYLSFMVDEYFNTNNIFYTVTAHNLTLTIQQADN